MMMPARKALPKPFTSNPNLSLPTIQMMKLEINPITIVAINRGTKVFIE
jgi:hypothetical protein